VNSQVGGKRHFGILQKKKQQQAFLISSIELRRLRKKKKKSLQNTKDITIENKSLQHNNHSNSS
jgi:hypothetical protein